MNNQLWSYLLTVVGLTGFALATYKVWWCWYINIFCQALWFTYAIVTEQYGFIAASIAYTVVFTNSAIKWTRDRKKQEPEPPADLCMGTISGQVLHPSCTLPGLAHYPHHVKEYQ